MVEDVIPLYRALEQAIKSDLVASAHGVYRGGLGVHLALVAIAGGLGLQVDLSKVPSEKVGRDDTLLYSESAGRFIVTVAPEDKMEFEKRFEGLPCGCVGQVTERQRLTIRGLAGRVLINSGLQQLKSAWKKPFANL